MSIFTIGIYTYAYFTKKLPINSANQYYFYDKDGTILTSGGKDWISLNEISEYLIDATISIEDKHFYSHHGFDYLRILKSLSINLKNGKTLQGASTISQQYVKNLFLDFDKTWKRKIEEAWLTVRLETQYSKEEILEGYLNTINYGGIFGIENASYYYFNKSAKDLTLAEATILAGIPKSPSTYSPLINLEASKKRQALILDSMVKNKMIKEEEKESALKEELVFQKQESKENSDTYRYYEDAVLNELKNLKSIPTSFLKTGGLRIYTNYDSSSQEALEESMKKNISSIEDFQVAGIIMEPSNGKVLALIGGLDYSKSQYNRAIQSKRQVGSTMKPFLYYAALENGFTASTTFTSEKTIFTFSEDKTYSPSNYSDTYPNKPISMAAALAYSDNIYAVKTHLFLGEDTLVEMAKRVGIEESLEAIPSLALGSKEINLLDMMRGYATLANEGNKVTPYFITKVEDLNGNTLYEVKEETESVLNKSIVYILNEMLTNCYASEFIDYTYPTCISIAPYLSHQYAIKSGTTDTDHLIFGYDKNVLIGIWGGYDDNRKSDVKNGTKVKQMWADTIEKYHETHEYSWYEMPKNVVGTLINPVSGEVSTDSEKKKMLYYIKGTEPSIEKTNKEDSIPTMKEETQ